MITIDWRSCESMADMPEQEKLEEWVSNYCDSIDDEPVILEIGSYKGQSTALLAQFGQVVAIDLHGNVDEGLRYYEDIGKHHYLAFIDNMIRLKLIERVHLVTSTVKFLGCVTGARFDIIYIDASHHYEDVKKDIEISKEYLIKDGLFIFDDYKRPGFGYPPYNPDHPHHSPNDPWAGVARAVDELISGGGYEEVEHFLGKLCLVRK